MLPIVAALVTVAVAQDTVRLTFPEALERARRNNPNFVTQRLDFDNAVIELASARAERYYPRLDLDFTLPQYESGIEKTVDRQGVDFTRRLRRTVVSELQLDQPLITGGSLRISGLFEGVDEPGRAVNGERYSGVTSLGFELEHQIFGINRRTRDYRISREQFARAEAEFADEERELSGEVMEAFYGLVQALKQAQIDSVIFVRDSIRNAGNTERGGRVRVAGTEVDSLKFELEALRSALNRTESDDELGEARTDLNEILALPTATVVIPDTVVTVERFVPDIAAGLASARARRQDLRLSELGVENREAGLRDARRTSPITLFLNSAIGFDGVAELPRASSAISNALSNLGRANTISVEISVPLFDRFEERHAVAEAQNDLRASQIELAEQNRQIESEVRDAARSVNNAVRRLDLAERQAQLTQRTLDIQMRRYAAEQITLVEFLIDQTAAREAEIELLEAQVDMLTATEQWRRAIGERGGLGIPR